MITLFCGQQTQSKIQALRPFEKLRRSGHPEVLTLFKGYATRQIRIVIWSGSESGGAYILSLLFRIDSQ
jgi:hypothetical protein